MDKQTLQLIKDSYQVLGNIHNNWVGRHTYEGQLLLCRLRDKISEAENLSCEDVQNSIEHKEK
jgi:hypothetical protein